MTNQEDSLARLTNWANELQELDVSVAEAEERFKALKADRKELAEQKIAKLMDDLDLTDFKTKDGVRIKLKSKMRCKITDDNRESAYDWLDEQGHGGIIKRQVAVGFSKAEGERALELIEQLREQYPDVKEVKDVHWSTLDKIINELAVQGEDVPLDLFGVYDQLTVDAKVDK